MNKQLLNNEDEYIKWAKKEYYSCYMPDTPPKSFPCYIVWITLEGSDCRDYTWYEFVYPSDFQEDNNEKI